MRVGGWLGVVREGVGQTTQCVAAETSVDKFAPQCHPKALPRFQTPFSTY